MSDEDIIGICSECSSDQPDSYMYKNVFAQAGKPATCKFCGGVVVIGNRKDKDDIIRKINTSRGIR